MFIENIEIKKSWEEFIEEYSEYFKSNEEIWIEKLNDVKKKLEIEVLWNDLIQGKFKNEINIDKKILKEKIKKEGLNKNLNIKYDLSEILFQVSDKASLTKIENEIQSIL